ncbi:hypothetical protein [Anaerofustis butyriciformans]|uniref:hypothetical protein n=2 Tax=Anaerofustis TaxID=264995 RepID=UPI003F8BAA01
MYNMDTNKDIDIKEKDHLNEENKDEDKEFHLDATSGEDRRKILASYKKSLRKRAFAPLIGGNVGINPIDLLKEEEAEKAKNQTLDIYDLMERRIAMLEKKVDQALSMARFSFYVSVVAILLMFLLLYIK